MKWADSFLSMIQKRLDRHSVPARRKRKKPSSLLLTRFFYPSFCLLPHQNQSFCYTSHHLLRFFFFCSMWALKISLLPYPVPSIWRFSFPCRQRSLACGSLKQGECGRRDWQLINPSRAVSSLPSCVVQPCITAHEQICTCGVRVAHWCWATCHVRAYLGLRSSPGPPSNDIPLFFFSPSLSFPVSTSVKRPKSNLKFLTKPEGFLLSCFCCCSLDSITSSRYVRLFGQYFLINL